MLKSLRHFPSSNKIIDSYGDSLNQPVYSRSPVSGEIGIEIELEGAALPEEAPHGWSVHNDGSLRNGGMEYVLSKPIPRKDVEKSLAALWGAFKNNGTRFTKSNRTSVHVHVNMSKEKVNTLVSTVALWAIMEDVLVDWCGSYRVGNVFCLRFRDAEWTLVNLIESLEQGNPFGVHPDYRYSALNLAAFQKFGSFEFRTLGECHDPERIQTWVEALLAIKEAALSKYQNPLMISDEFSGLGGVGFLEDILGNTRIIRELRLNDDAESSLWQGLRRVQRLINCLPWVEMLPEINKEYVPNPFGTNKKRKKKIPYPGGEEPAPLRWADLEAPDRDVMINEARVLQEARNLLRPGNIIPPLRDNA